MAIIGKYSLNGNANAQVGPNGTATNVTYVAGKSGQAGSFNGTSSNINLGNVFNFSGTTNFSISALVYYTGNRGYIVSKFAPGISGQWIIQVRDDNRIRLSRNIFPNFINSPAVLNINKWNYIVGTYDGTAMRIYHNGILVAGPVNSGSVASNTRNVRIGSDDNNGNYHNGLIDEVEIENRALTPTEIKNKFLYYNGFM